MEADLASFETLCGGTFAGSDEEAARHRRGCKAPLPPLGDRGEVSETKARVGQGLKLARHQLELMVFARLTPDTDGKEIDRPATECSRVVEDEVINRLNAAEAQLELRYRAYVNEMEARRYLTEGYKIMDGEAMIDVSLTTIKIRGKVVTTIQIKNADKAKIHKLCLRNNRIPSLALPAEIWNMASLRELHLQTNQLTSLPAEIGRLTGLTWLDLNNNRLTLLPVEIGMLTGLMWLDLNDNKLTSLPVEIGRLTSLTWLDVSLNPLTSPPREVCKEGTAAIRAYFLEHPQYGEHAMNYYGFT